MPLRPPVKVPSYTPQMNVAMEVPYPLERLLLCGGLLGFFMELSVSFEIQD